MIFDSFSHIDRYVSVAPGFAAAVEAMKNYSKENFPVGKVKVQGDDVYLNLQSYSTVPMSQRELEVHEKYIDIFYLVEGRETALCKPSENLSEITQAYNPEKDIYFAKRDNDATLVALQEGTFAVFFPGEAHASGIDVEGTQTVKKIVTKIRMK